MNHCFSGGDQGFKCDSMVLGALTKGLQSIGLLLAPDPPYKGLSFQYLVQQVCNMSFPTFCNEIDEYRGHKYHKKQEARCGIKAKLEAYMDVLEDSLSGINLRNLHGVDQDD